MNTTQDDLEANFNWLGVLCDSALGRLSGYIANVSNTEVAYIKKTQDLLLAQAAQLHSEYTNLAASVAACLLQTRTSASVPANELLVQKRELQDRLRVLQSFLGSVLSAGNWQAPSVAHTHESQAGNQTGMIRAYENDYKRDRHLDECVYARKFIAEYVEHPKHLTPVAFITSSGMAALSTAFIYLSAKMPPGGVVLAGRSTYFQTRWLLEHLFPNRVQYVSENDTQEILNMAGRIKPAIVFFDTLSNNAVGLTDIETLLPGLSNILSHTATIVLDNTGLSLACQPLRSMPLSPLSPRLLVVESLSKYHQFGLDRVNGGVLWSPFGVSVLGLRMAHANTGTIAPDMSTLMYPEPNRAVLEQRLSRIGRNTLRFAKRVEQSVSLHKKSPVTQVFYPGLSTHPAYTKTRGEGFCGGFFTCQLTSSIFNPFAHTRLVDSILSEARKRNVRVVVGSGFGFDTTRIYVLPSMWGVQEMLLRISVGTETIDEIDMLGDAIIAALFATAE